MSNINDIIRGRKSSYPPQFKGEIVSKEIISELLENANSAPTHKLTEPWRYKVFTEKGKTKLTEAIINAYKKSTDDPQQSRIEKISNNVEKSSFVIAIILHRDERESIPEWEEIASVAMSVQNIWVSLDQYGLGGYWGSPSFASLINEDFKLKKNEKCLGFFFVGNVDPSEKKIKKGDINQKVEWFS